MSKHRYRKEDSFLSLQKVVSWDDYASAFNRLARKLEKEGMKVSELTELIEIAIQIDRDLTR